MVLFNLQITEDLKLSVVLHSTSDMTKLYIIPHDKWNGTTNYASISDVQLNISGADYSNVFTASELSGLNNKLYFVVVESEDGVFVGTVFNKQPLYVNFMRLIRQLTESCCEPPMEFVNLHLQLKALEYAISSEHYVEATNIYDKFFMANKATGEIRRGCNCHG